MTDIEDTVKKSHENKTHELYVIDLYKMVTSKDYTLNEAQLVCRRKYHTMLSKMQLNGAYQKLLKESKISNDFYFHKKIIKKISRSQSGYAIVCLFTAPGRMLSDTGDPSCPKDCDFCPAFPNQPRSYDPDEPAARRASRNNFDPVSQINDRLSSLKKMGHNIQKIQLEISGGTWCYYPRDYIDEFVRDSYHAVNNFGKKSPEPRYSLEEEIRINQCVSENKVVGITIETRPDSINKREIIRLRRYNITRVQLGVQHTSNAILFQNNRDSTIEDAYQAIRLLKCNGFKVDLHIMPDLPGTTPEIDNQMLKTFATDSRLKCDYYKVYPCQVLDHTKIKEKYLSGEYKPMADTPEGFKALVDNICDFKELVHESARINRIVRDFPGTSIRGGLNRSNLRQDIQKEMILRCMECRCIRCREVKTKEIDRNDTIVVIRKFEASEGIEYFISIETKDKKTIIGFTRLRFNNNNDEVFFDELANAAIIRELHVYGLVTNLGTSESQKYQHHGYGKLLLKRAEHIARTNGYKKIAIISGVGVRGYYEKRGYTLSNTYMVKKIKKVNNNNILGVVMIAIAMYMIFVKLFF